jgi:hypothetical protein
MRSFGFAGVARLQFVELYLDTIGTVLSVEWTMRVTTTRDYHSLGTSLAARSKFSSSMGVV